jgi:hypothetical protein
MFEKHGFPSSGFRTTSEVMSRSSVTSTQTYRRQLTMPIGVKMESQRPGRDKP